MRRNEAWVRLKMERPCIVCMNRNEPECECWALKRWFEAHLI